MFKKWSINISKYFFLLLFLGFFGSLTFFNHAHVVYGVTIVHSHPFKSDKNGIPTHNHTSNGYLLIHLLANFTVTAILILILINPIPNILYKIIIKVHSGIFNLTYLLSYLLRGPPAKMLI